MPRRRPIPAHPVALTADERLSLIIDPGSFEPWDEDIVSTDPLGFLHQRSYAEQLAEARASTGATEAVRTGRAALDGRPLAVIVSEFRFFGGSIGVASGERITRAVERAHDEGIPLVAVPASGGSRMQEGTLALLQMAKIAAAIRRFLDSGGLYAVYLTHPTTGGVLASWGSLGVVTLAMPGAMIGFAGPRVAELTTGRRFPPHVQTAEHLYERGLIDGLVEPDRVRERLSEILSVQQPRRPPARQQGVGARPRIARPRRAAARAGARAGDAWMAVQHARHPDRPVARDLLAAWATDLTPLRDGGRGASDDPACFVALGETWGIPMVVVAQARDRRRSLPARLSAGGYRKARRGFQLAGQLALPLLTIVDSPGAELSVEAEEDGLSREIARCLSELSVVTSPTLAVLLGEGGSGGALALMTTDRVVAAENATLAVISPEGASAILYHSTVHAPEMAASQAGASWELERWGIADVVVREPVPAHLDPAGFIGRLGAAVHSELGYLLQTDAGERLAARGARYRNVGG